MCLSDGRKSKDLLSQNSMEWNVVSKSVFGDILPLSRIDAEYVIPSLLSVEMRLRDLKGGKLSALVGVYDGPQINESYAEEDEILEYIAIDSIDTEDGLTYSEEELFTDLPSRAAYKLEMGDMLVSNVRPNRGAVSLITERNAGSIGSSGFTLLRKRPDAGISQEFIFAFLKTDYGRNQLIRRNRGSMYPAVLQDDVFDIWIPKPSEKLAKQVTEKVGAALSCHDEFFSLIGKRETILSDFLKPYGAPPSPLETAQALVNWTEVHSSDFFGTDGPKRIDADFFRSEYREFDDHCKKLGASILLGDLYNLSPGGGVGEGEENIPVIKQAVLTNAGINWSAVVYQTGSSSCDVHELDILLACTAHEIFYVGRKVDLVRKVPANLIDKNSCVADVMILKPKTKEIGKSMGSYVAAFLRCPTGLHQVQRCIRGLRGGHVYKDDLSDYVRIAVPSKAFLEEFDEITEKAENKRNEGKIIMKEAIRSVTYWISKTFASC
jgi:hypothetical protein